MRKVADKIMEIVFLVLACVSIVAVVIVCYFMFSRGIPAIRQIGLGEFITGKIWKPTYDYFGILPMIVGSLMVTAGALVIGVPVGIFMAVFMARFCPRIIYKIANPIVNLLAGIPSIIYGFFGMMIVVPFIREHIGGKGYSILSASIILGIMILPTIISVSEAAIKAVPESYYEGALALGATKEISVFKTVLPAAKSGIMAAVTLGIGRAIGETMADGSRQSAKTSAQYSRRCKNTYHQYSNRNGVCSGSAQRGTHCDRRCAFCVHTDNQSPACVY